MITEKIKHSESPWTIKETRIGRIICSKDKEVGWIDKGNNLGFEDAALIASSPELLEACKRAIETIENIRELNAGEDITTPVDNKLMGLELMLKLVVLKSNGWEE